jgi:hypothetical protein
MGLLAITKSPCELDLHWRGNPWGGLAQRVRARRGPMTDSGVTHLFSSVDYAEFIIGRAFARPVG